MPFSFWFPLFSLSSLVPVYSWLPSVCFLPIYPWMVALYFSSHTGSYCDQDNDNISVSEHTKSNTVYIPVLKNIRHMVVEISCIVLKRWTVTGRQMEGSNLRDLLLRGWLSSMWKNHYCDMILYILGLRFWILLYCEMA